MPGCGLKCVVSDLSSSIKNAKNSPELSSFTSLVSAGSSGTFKVNGVEVEVYQSANTRLGHLIGMGDAPEDVGLGEYTVIVGKNSFEFTFLSVGVLFRTAEKLSVKMSTK